MFSLRVKTAVKVKRADAERKVITASVSVNTVLWCSVWALSYSVGFKTWRWCKQHRRCTVCVCVCVWGAPLAAHSSSSSARGRVGAKHVQSQRTEFPAAPDLSSGNSHVAFSRTLTRSKLLMLPMLPKRPRIRLAPWWQIWQNNVKHVRKIQKNFNFVLPEGKKKSNIKAFKTVIKINWIIVDEKV